MRAQEERRLLTDLLLERAQDPETALDTVRRLIDRLTLDELTEVVHEVCGGEVRERENPGD